MGFDICFSEFTAGETRCDAREDRVQCFGALGGTVIIRLMNNASEIPKHEWKNKTSIILRGEGHTFFQNVLPNRLFFLSSNDTISLTNLSRSDSGEYNLEIFDSEGQKTVQTLQLLVQGKNILTEIDLSIDFFVCIHIYIYVPHVTASTVVETNTLQVKHSLLCLGQHLRFSSVIENGGS